MDIPATCLGFRLEDSSVDGDGKEVGGEENSTGENDEEGTN